MGLSLLYTCVHTQIIVGLEGGGVKLENKTEVLLMEVEKQPSTQALLT